MKNKRKKIIINNNEKVLDLGCKNSKIPGAIGVDVCKDTQADVIHDLEVFPYPFETNSIDKIYTKHLIEHLNNPKGFLKEVHRILKSGGEIYIETPHFSNYVAYAEPEHKLYYSYFMFKNLISAGDFVIESIELTFYKTFRFFGIRFLANKFPEQYERFWTYLFPAECIIAKLKKI